MILLDTNVVSALMNQNPEPRVVAWLDRQPEPSIWTTSITVLEIRFGMQILPSGKRRTFLLQAFEAVLDNIGRRVVSFDGPAAWQAADLMASRQKKGRPRELRDTLIAGIALANHATIATRNTSHFEDLPTSLVNPWTL
jgi:predicted nucleic acid-binding protein